MIAAGIAPLTLAFLLGLFLGTGVGCLIVSLCVAAACNSGGPWPLTQGEPQRRSGPHSG